jgi:polyhydroxyalkanoate synthesis repressor PhaR
LKVIKKYENRCLYDAELSTNITTDDLKQYVIDCVPFKVVNAKTNEDLTRDYLIQIILELEGLNNPLFSQTTLENIIRFYGHPMQESIQVYLEQAMAFMAQQQQSYKDTVKNTSPNDLIKTWGKLAESNVRAWQNLWAPTPKKDE